MLYALLSSVGCERSEPPSVPLPALIPTLSVYPPDLVSNLQIDPPPLLLSVDAPDGLAISALTEQLLGRVELTGVRGGATTVRTETVAPTRSLNSESWEPSGMLVTPERALGAGWVELKVDVSRLEVTLPADVHIVDGWLVTRLNVGSAPTVRRISICPSVSQIHVEFSEPTLLVDDPLYALELFDQAGYNVECVVKGDEVHLDGDGTVLSVQCANPLPQTLDLTVPQRSFASAISGKRVTARDGSEFSAILDYRQLPLAGNGQGDCGVFVPP
ncbi:MAG: hypothetical protein ABMA64_23610 [Myxococcota bacterium]